MIWCRFTDVEWCVQCICVRVYFIFRWQGECVQSAIVWVCHMAVDFGNLSPKYKCVEKSVMHRHTPNHSVILNGVIYIGKRLLLFFFPTFLFACLRVNSFRSLRLLHNNGTHTGLRRAAQSLHIQIVVWYGDSGKRQHHCDSNVDFRLILWIGKTIIDYIDAVRLASECARIGTKMPTSFSHSRNEHTQSAHGYAQTKERKKNASKSFACERREQAQPTDRPKGERQRGESGVYRFSWFMEWIEK